MKPLLNLVALLLLPAAASADIIIAFDNPTQTARPGQTLQFFGTITNTGTDPDPVYLNGDSVSFNLSTDSYTLADQFFSTVPATLAGGESSGDIELFDVTLSMSLADPFGTYAGAYQLLGGSIGPADNLNLAQADFSVTAVPSGVAEPATLLLFGTGFALMSLLHRSRRTGCRSK